jgi:hypothetical protein
MMAERIITEIGESCLSWSCYRCGEVIDPEILRNRGAMRPESHLNHPSRIFAEAEIQEIGGGVGVG